MLNFYRDSQNGISFDERYGKEKANRIRLGQSKAAKDKHWWNNGKIEILCLSQPNDASFVKGRLKRTIL